MCCHACDPSSALAWGSSTSSMSCVWRLLPSALSRARSSSSFTASDPRFKDVGSAGASAGVSAFRRSGGAGHIPDAPCTCAPSFTMIRFTSASSFSYVPLPSEMQPCADLRHFERWFTGRAPNCYRLCKDNTLHKTRFRSVKLFKEFAYRSEIE